MKKIIKNLLKGFIQLLRRIKSGRRVSFGKGSYVGKNVAFHGNAIIGCGSYIGEHSIIAPETKIGKYCMLLTYSPSFTKQTLSGLSPSL